jgi:hypothetical protein
MSAPVVVSARFVEKGDRPAEHFGSGIAEEKLCARVPAGPSSATARRWLNRSGTPDAPTGTGSDTVTLTNGILASILQPAGDYTGRINYSVIPSYSGTAAC